MVNPEYYSNCSRIACISQPPAEALKYVRRWQLHVGFPENIIESDIVPWPIIKKHNAYKSLLYAMDEACAVLRQCYQVHELHIKMRIEEDTLGSTALLLTPLLKLRDIRYTVLNIASGESMDGWYLKGGYCNYMSCTMALPEGMATPEYDGDEDESNNEEETTEGIFEFYDRDNLSDGSYDNYEALTGF
jgi:hypothetical protein